MSQLKKQKSFTLYHSNFFFIYIIFLKKNFTLYIVNNLNL